MGRLGKESRRVSTGAPAAVASLAQAFGVVVVTAATAASIGACHTGNTDTGRRAGVRVRIRSFTEASPVRLAITVGPYVFTASGTGVDRWNLRTGLGLRLTADDGLPGNRVVALAADIARGAVWIATDGGIARYHVESGTFSTLPAAPKILGLADFAGSSLAPASDGGLWIGSSRGLFYTNGDGQWSPTPITRAITSLRSSRDGVLWIGTSAGLMSRQPDGETFEYAEDQGCDLAAVHFIAEAPDGGPLIVGESDEGSQRVVRMIDGSCATYRVSPDLKWTAAARRGNETVVMAGGRLYAMRSSGTRGRRLTRNGMRLQAVKVGAAGQRIASPYVFAALDYKLPAGVTALAVAGKEIVLGTRDLGSARLETAGGSSRAKSRRWLRSSELVDGARDLSVACASRSDCYVSIGTMRGWRFDGKSFSPFGDGKNRILAFVRSPDGTVFGLREDDDHERLLLAPIRDGIWVRVNEVAIKVPRGRPSIGFARFSPSSVLWVGLFYTDDESEELPYGVALVDVSLGVVAYHHASRSRREVRQGVLPIPNNVVDASFMDDDETWLATTEGAARVQGQVVNVFSESEGMSSELLRGIACSKGGMVYVASSQGVGAYDGESWKNPRPLRFPVNDLEIARDGRLWMASERGVAVFDGERVRRLDVRRGLLQNHVDDVALDAFGRVWTRGSAGITIIVP